MTDTVALFAENLDYGYARDSAVFTQVNLEIRAGRLTAITGPSGCGKSTLMYILAGLLRPRRGVVMVDGRDLFALTDSERSLYRAQRFGFVFQDFALDSRRTVRDNVLEPALYASRGCPQIEARAVELLEGFGIGELLDARPVELSGGQAQRVALARALLLRPSIIFADEPTGNLDSESAKAVLAALEQVASMGAAVVVVTHDDRMCERSGEVIEFASLSSLS